MLKKSLIAIAVLALAMPAFAGDAKFHDWPCEYVPQEIACLDVVLDIGFYIHIVNQDPIVLEQIDHYMDGDDPFFTYAGQHCTDVVTNFPATLSLSTKDVVDWVDEIEATFTDTGTEEQTIPVGTTEVCIDVVAKEVDLAASGLTGGTLGTVIGQVCISVVPAAGAFGNI